MTGTRPVAVDQRISAGEAGDSIKLGRESTCEIATECHEVQYRNVVASGSRFETTKIYVSLGKITDSDFKALWVEMRMTGPDATAWPVLTS